MDVSVNAHNDKESVIDNQSVALFSISIDTVDDTVNGIGISCFTEKGTFSLVPKLGVVHKDTK